MSITAQVLDLAAWEHETRNLRGEWTHGASLNVAHGQEQHGYEGKFMGYDPLNPPMTPADGRKPLELPGRPDGAGTPDDPIDPQGDMGRAVDLMIAGKHVRLAGPGELPALADEINRRGDQVGAGVGSNPPWDLGNVSVRGTRLFNEQTTGIARADMPQLAGKAQPGSEAALLAGGANHFFIADPQFRAQLERDGVDVKDERVNADQLRATQTQLTATTVAGIARADVQGNAKVAHMLTEPIWVTKDNYVIDGHHRWAAGEMIAAMRGNFPGRQIEVHRINLPVALAIPYANQFAQRIGIATKPLGGKLVGAANIVTQALDMADAWMHEARDLQGEWTRFGGLQQAARTISHSPEGFSVSLHTGESPPSGYMVAQTGHTHTFPESVLNDRKELAAAIDKMLITEKDAFGKDTYLGGWVHDGKLWLEPSDNITSRAEAVKAGENRDQIAIWDVNGGQEISTGGSGGGQATEHASAFANPQGDREGAGGLRGPPGGRAAEDSRRAGWPVAAGIAEQVLELASTAWLHEHRGWHGRWGYGTGPGPEAHPLKKLGHPKTLPSGLTSSDYKNAIDAVTARNLKRGQWIAYASSALDPSGFGFTTVFRPVRITSVRHKTVGRGKRRHPWVTYRWEEQDGSPGGEETLRAGAQVDTMNIAKLEGKVKPPRPRRKPAPPPLVHSWEPPTAAPAPPHPMPTKAHEPGDISTVASGGYDKPQVMAAMQEAQRGLDYQAQWLPGLAKRQTIHITDDFGGATPSKAIGQEIPRSERVDLKSKIFDAFSGPHKTTIDKQSGEDMGWWTPTDTKYTLSDVTIAHEFGHVVAEELPERYQADLWKGIAAQMHLEPPIMVRDILTRYMHPATDVWIAMHKDDVSMMVSDYGTSDHFEMEAELWRNFTMSSHPSKLATWYGNYMLAHLPKRDR